MARNILIEKNVGCPICKNRFKVRFANPKLYAASGRDDDRRVTGYIWAQGIKTEVVPHYYMVAQCPQCLYADLKENFEDPRHTAKIVKMADARQNLNFKKVMILKKLHRLIPEEEVMSIEAAIAMHLSAIYFALLAGDKEYIDHNKLGRLYLRLSWLHREQSGKSGEIPGTGPLESAVPSTIDELDRSVNALQGDLTRLMEGLGAILGLVDRRSRELDLPKDRKQNPYISGAMSIELKITEMQAFLELLHQAVQQDKMGRLGIGGSPIPDEPAAEDSQEGAGFRQLMKEIAVKWPEMPRTEETCIRRAVDAFEFSFKFEDTGQSIEQSLSGANLLVKLMLRINDLEGALQQIMDVFKRGFRDKQELQMRLSQGKREKKLTPADERYLTKQIGRVTSALTQAGETRKQVLKLMYARDEESIRQILAPLAQAVPEQQVHALKTVGINDELIHFVKEKGLIKEEENKKGWFGRKK